MHKIGLYGDTGLVGQEIEKILKNHDKVKIVFRQNLTRSIFQIQNGNLVALEECNLVILPTPTPASLEIVPQLLGLEKRVIDLSGAYRLKNAADFEKWYGMKHTSPELLEEAVYGLPAFYQKQIAGARLVANPGCYSTSVILTLNPLQDMIEGVEGEIIIYATSGISGARRQVAQKPNVVTYAHADDHQHFPEMRYYSGFDIDFNPIREDTIFSGINANIRAKSAGKLKAMSDENAAKEIIFRLQQAYQPEDLVTVVYDFKDKYGTGQVIGTHKTLIKVYVKNGKVYISSMIDNLGKGAASQAVENMNIMLGLPRLYGIHPVYKID